MSKSVEKNPKVDVDVRNHADKFECLTTRRVFALRDSFDHHLRLLLRHFPLRTTKNSSRRLLRSKWTCSKRRQSVHCAMSRNARSSLWSPAKMATQVGRLSRRVFFELGAEFGGIALATLLRTLAETAVKQKRTRHVLTFSGYALRASRAERMFRLTAIFQTHTFANGLGKKVLQHISYISRGVERYAKEETLKVRKSALSL